MAATRLTVWRFYAYRISVSNGFYLPVSILYLQRIRGFTLADIGLITGAFSIAMVAAEIPTGYIGDRLGRLLSLILGNVIITVFMAGYTIVETPLEYLMLHVLWAFGWAFRSGTADAWLYELLAAGGDADAFTRIRGRATSIELGFEAVTAAAASVLVTISWSLPFLANAAVAVIGIPLLLTAPSTPSRNDGDDCRDNFTVHKALETLRLQVGRREIRWFIAYATLFSALYQVVRVFEQPALDAVGIPATGFGLLYAGFKLVSAGAASTTGWVADRFGARTVYALLVPVWTLAFLGVAAMPLFIVPVLFLNRSLKAITRPIRNQYLNDRLGDVGRATVLSGVSMVMMSAGGIAKFTAGAMADSIGLLQFLVAAGISIPIVAGLLWLTVTPIQKETPAANTGTATME